MRKARASWVARRTLHRRVGAPVGEVEGLPTYSIEGTRVALPRGAHHFRRVVACARCQRAMMDDSRPLHRRTDLHVEIAVLCDECAQLPVSPGNVDESHRTKA